MPGHILVTGSTGFIGRQLTSDLVAQGHNVRVLVRDQRKAERLFGPNVDIMQGDLADADAIQAACRGIQVAYHIGGIYRFGLRHRRELWRINVEGTEKLLRSAAKEGLARIVHLSSGGLLRKTRGTATFSSLLDENDFPLQPPTFSPYKFTKWHAEQRALLWARRGLPVVIASTTCPIGRGDDGPTPTGQMIRDFLDQRFPFYCRTALNFIDVQDLSEGLQEVASNGQKGRRYLFTNENMWLKDFLDLLSRETGLPSPRSCLPNWSIHLAGFGGEIAEYMSPRGSGARVCLETARQVAKAKFFSNARTREELGWKPQRSIRESVRQAIAWIRQETAIPCPEKSPSPLAVTVP